MKKILLIILSIIVIIPAVAPFFNSGFFVVHDNTQVERVFQMTKSLSDGQFPVRWVDDLGYGYGYPIFNFYAPFPYYIAGFLNLILSDSLLSTKIMFIIGTVFSFFTMYLFARNISGRAGGFTAAVTYLYFPYHAVNIYVRGAVGEFFAYAFFPAVFLGIYYIYEKADRLKSKKIVLESFFIAVPVALVAISHNLSAFMMGLLLIPYILFLIFKSKKRIKFILSLIILFFTALLFSSFYILPAIFESSYTNVMSQIGGGADYPDHFVCINQLWHSNWGFGGSILGCTDGLSFAIGKFNILLILTSFLLFAFYIFKKRRMNNEIIFWILLSISIFLMLPFSKFIWDTLPFMEYLQFPWRFLNFVGLFSALVIGLSIQKIKMKRIQFAILIVVLLGQFYFNAKLFRPATFNDLGNSYYENIDHIRYDTSKISDEYMPNNFTKPESEMEVPRDVIEPVFGTSMLLVNYKTGYIEFVSDGSGGLLKINKASFPGWKAEVDNKPVGIIESQSGVAIKIPEGRHNIVLKIVSTPIQTIGNVLSLVGVLVIIVAIIIKNKKLYE